MFESKLFSELCDEAKKEEVFNGKPVHSKEEVYQEVAVLCNMSPETVRKWACKGSKGPRDANRKKDLITSFSGLW